MTAPVEPTPGAPAVEPTPQPHLQVPPREPAPAKPDDANGAKPPWERDGQPFDPARAWALTEKLRAEIAQLKDPATTSRQAQKLAAEAAEQAKRDAYAELGRSLGLVDDDDANPDVLAERIEQAQDFAWKSGVELAVYRGASALGADPSALLDSLSFIQSLDALSEDTPGTPEFDAALAKAIAAALEQNPTKYKAAQAAAPVSPGQAPGPRPDPSQGTRGPVAPQRAQSLAAAVAAHYAANK